MQTDPLHEPISVVAVRSVPDEHVEAFENEVRNFLAHALRHPGFQGVQVLRRPHEGAVEFTLLAHFADCASRSAFIATPAYLEWMKRLEALSSGPAAIDEHAGLAVWFTLPGRPAASAPPAWKIAVVTWLAVNLVTTALLPWLPPLLGFVPFPLDNFLFNLPVVGLLTWIVMPWATRLFHPWLRPVSSVPTARS